MNNKFDMLKVEDSGEEDVNEQSKGETPTKMALPGEHPLQFNYAFWFSRRNPGGKQTSYDQNLKQVFVVQPRSTTMRPGNRSQRLPSVQRGRPPHVGRRGKQGWG